MSPDGPPAAAASPTASTSGGPRSSGLALGPADEVVAEARVPTPRGRARSPAARSPGPWPQVVVDLDPRHGRQRYLDGTGGRRAHRGWWTARAACASPPTCPRPREWTGPSSIGARLPGRTGPDRERRQLRRAGRAPAGRGPGLPRRRDGDAGDRHRGRHRRRRPGPGRRGRLRRRDRPHGRRPGRAAVPVRAPGLLGALRLGRRTRRPGPGGGAGGAAGGGRAPGRG